MDSHLLMLNALDAIEARADDENIYVGTRIQRQARERYANLSDDTAALDRWAATYVLAKAELQLGNTDTAIELYTEAETSVRGSTTAVRQELLTQFYFDMATAYLRFGETQNCCQQHLPSSCILPIQPEAVHRHPEGSQRAIQWFTVVLNRTSPDDDMHLATRWLLNVAYATIGMYPESVPKLHLIPALDVDNNSKVQFPVFRNVAELAGVDTFSLAGGAIADDFDNDGHIDLIVSSFDPHESLQVFWNRGDGRFDKGAESANVKGIRGGLNLVQADFNNDGWVDIFVTRGGWLAQFGCHPNSLLQNNGDRTFTDVTATAGLEASGSFPTQAAAWADYDLDGDLDLYIGNESSVDIAAPSQLFQNQGDGTFRDVAKLAGVTNDLFAKAVTWGDYDGDRYPDLYVSNYRGTNRLYHNQGDGTFAERAKDLGVQGPDASFPTWFCDVNNDGQLDLYVSAYAGGIAELAASLLDKPFNREKTLPRLYIGHGSRFIESAEQWGLDAPTHPMGANFGDLDNDGFLDFYLGTGWPEIHELMPNVLYRGGATRFEDLTRTAGVGHLQKGHAVAMADFDNDGDLDLFEQMGGFVPADKYYDVLYQNPGTENHWLKVKLVGTKSNRSAIGARIEVRLISRGTAHSVYRHVGSGGSFGANPLEQHIGIGSAERIDAVVVLWPVSGESQVVQDIPLDSKVEIVEGD